MENSSGVGKKKIIYGMCAGLLFAVLLAMTCYGRLPRERATVRIVVLGDSILGDCRDETSVPSLLAEYLGEPIFNGTLGGTTMGRQDREIRLANTKDCLSLQALAQSIAADDFGVQQTVRSRENATEYFAGTIDALEKIDFDSVDILLIEHGINDYHSGVPIENKEEPFDAYSFTGALRSAVTTLQRTYPELRIILVTPTYSWYPANEIPGLTCEEYDLGGGLLEEYVNAEIREAQSMGVEVLDLYHDYYPHDQWSEWSLYTKDGVHPNEAGRRLLAETLYEYLVRGEVPIS